MSGITSVPYESTVSVSKPVVVAWCPHSETFESDYRPGSTCYMCEGNDFGERHRVHKRLMWICPICGCGFFAREGLLEHEHDECCP